jgi:hypothetical protein
MTYTTNLVYDPDKYHYSYVRDVDSTGFVPLTVNDLNLPSRCVYIEVDTPPDYGTLKLNGVTILDSRNNAIPTQISKADIALGLLVWDANASDVSIRLNFDYFAYDSQGETQSMLYNWLPITIQLEPTEEVDGGDFDSGESLGGVSSDGGDFVIGGSAALLQSYDGGNFDTGESSYPETPDLGLYEATINTPLKVVDPDTLAPVTVSSLPSTHEVFPRNSDVFRYEFKTEYTYEYKFSFKKKLFKGWNYGANVPNFGYSSDYGSISNPTTNLTVDFNNIVEYNYPYPPSRLKPSAH